MVKPLISGLNTGAVGLLVLCSCGPSESTVDSGHRPFFNQGSGGPVSEPTPTPTPTPTPGNVPSLSFVGVTGTFIVAGSPVTWTPSSFSDGGSVVTSCQSTPTLPAWASFSLSDCSFGGTPNAPLGTTTFELAAVNAVGASAPTSLTLRVCPEHYARSQANSSVGTSADFCVMVYEARNNGGQAVFSTTSPVWSNISHANAISACNQLNGSGATSYSLITNPEWLTVARNIESVGSNWSNGSVGDAFLNRGWSALTANDGFSNSAGTTNTSSSCIYNTAANTCGASGVHNLKRTHLLPLGDTIWDFAGNFSEYINWSVPIGGSGVHKKAFISTLPLTIDRGWRDFKNLDSNISTGDPMEPVTWRASNGTWDSSQGIGQYYAGTQSVGGFARRGGRRDHGVSAGVYSLLVNQTDAGFADTSFRCVFKPGPLP